MGNSKWHIYYSGFLAELELWYSLVVKCKLGSALNPRRRARGLRNAFDAIILILVASWEMYVHNLLLRCQSFSQNLNGEQDKADPTEAFPELYLSGWWGHFYLMDFQLRLQLEKLSKRFHLTYPANFQDPVDCEVHDSCKFSASKLALLLLIAFS
jgi:hypothetical protein